MVRLDTGEWVQVDLDLVEQYPGDEDKWRTLMTFRGLELNRDTTSARTALGMRLLLHSLGFAPVVIVAHGGIGNYISGGERLANCGVLIGELNANMQNSSCRQATWPRGRLNTCLFIWPRGCSAVNRQGAYN